MLYQGVEAKYRTAHYIPDTTCHILAAVHIIFCGTSAFALPCLQALAREKRCTVDAVITQADKPVGRKQILTPPPVKLLAQQLKMPVLQPAKINAEWKSIVEGRQRPEFLVVVSYGQILSQEILDFPTIAAVNVHASLLPKLRGASPIQHAILQSMEKTGVTVQRMVKELDAGPVLGQQEISIGARETAQGLHDLLADMGAKLLIDVLSETLHEEAQDASHATFCGKLSRTDGVVDAATMTAQEIDRTVRALTPWPGVTWNGMKLLLTSLEPSADAYAIPCKKNTTLYAVTVQPPGKKPMSGADFARGQRTSPSR